MNRKYLYLPLVAVLSLLFARSSFAQGTAFFYQGQLDTGGAGATGHYDFAFTVYNAETNGSAVSDTLTNFDVPVNNGLFTTTLDFGANIFTGSSVWLDIGVRTNGAATGFTELSPRQPVLAVPYAIFANSASNLVGTSAVALTNGANLFAGTFSGNGGGVTNVSVTNLTGVLVDSQLPTNTAFLNSNQTFTANNIFNGTNTFNGPDTFNGSNTFNGANNFTNLYGNSFSGSFFGNGLVGWVVVPGTTVQAQIDHGYLLTNSQVVTVTLPTGMNVGDIVRIAGAGAGGWQVAQNANQSILGNFFSYNKTWYPSSASDLNWTAIASSSDGTKMAATFEGTSSYGIYLSTDSGQVWVSSSAQNFPYDAIASSSDGTMLVAVTAGNSIFSSTNSGSSWITDTASDESWAGVASSSSGINSVAVANGVGIYTNSGTTWGQSYKSGGNGNDWTCVAYAGGSEFVAGDSGSGIYVSTNNGVTWTERDSSQTPAWQSIASSLNGTRMIAAVSGGGVYISTNSATNFTEQASLPESASWSSVASSSDGSKLVAVVNGGNIYTSSNWGATWQTNTLTANWSGVTSSSDGKTLAAVVNNNSTSTGPYGIYNSLASAQVTTTTAGIAGYISGAQCSSVELQCIGTNQFMPVNVSGSIWAY